MVYIFVSVLVAGTVGRSWGIFVLMRGRISASSGDFFVFDGLMRGVIEYLEDRCL